jgi:hypothetical protein
MRNARNLFLVPIITAMRHFEEDHRWSPTHVSIGLGETHAILNLSQTAWVNATGSKTERCHTIDELKKTFPVICGLRVLRWDADKTTVERRE